MIKAGDETGFDWVAANGEHDRDCRRGRPGCNGRNFAASRDEDRNSALDQLGSERRQSIVSTIATFSPSM
jgi:hypothetical protein